MTEPARPLWVVIPVKPLAQSKRRLAGAYDARARAALAESLFRRTLRTALGARGVDRVVVVSRDRAALRQAREAGALPLREVTRGLNAALEGATREAIAHGAGALLVLPIDLPRLTTADIESLIALGTPPPCVVLAPARRDAGTNALLVSPPGLIHYAFGRDSLRRHRQVARDARARCEIYDSERVAWDVDRPEDLDRFNFPAGADFARP